MAQGGGQDGERRLAGAGWTGVVGHVEAEIEVGIAQAAAHQGGDSLGLGVDALGERLVGGWRGGLALQAGLAGETVADGGGEALPVGLGDALLQAGAEVGQHDLAHLAGPDADGMDEAAGDALAGTLRASQDTAHEHELMAPQSDARVTMWSYVVSTFEPHRQSGRKRPKSPPFRRGRGSKTGSIGASVARIDRI